MSTPYSPEMIEYHATKWSFFEAFMEHWFVPGDGPRFNYVSFTIESWRAWFIHGPPHPLTPEHHLALEYITECILERDQPDLLTWGG